MVTVIIPAQHEQNYLNKTIENIFNTAKGKVEVIVVLNGYDQKVDKRARVRRFEENVGERAAMNFAAKKAKGEFLLRIDAHCDFDEGWDIKMSEVTGERDITVAVLGAAAPVWEHVPDKRRQQWLDSGKTPEQWQPWERLKGHWYGLCRMIVSEDGKGNKGFECKWQKPNRDHSVYKTVEPNMGLTGCGFMIRKKFYNEIGGADETLPAMGAIGEEFALKAWANGGKVQTRTDVMIYHVWGTGGYDTSGVKLAQQKLYLKYQNIYPSIVEKFPHFEGMKLIRTDQPGRPIRTVTVDRQDNHDTRDEDGNLIRRKIEKFRYVWLETEHPEDKGLTQKQIEEKYAPYGTKIGEEILYATETGELVKNN